MIALSTAFSKAMIGLDINGKPHYLTLDSSCKQAENILKSIDELLDKNDLNIGDIDTFAIVIGPGSFTGLRIGTALVKGFCAGSKKPCRVVAISSLDWMAYEYVKQIRPETDFTCVINALSDMYFVCEYNKLGNKLGQERLIENEEYKKLNLSKIGLREEDIAENKVTLSAQGLLEYAKILAKEGKFVDFKSLSPKYLRKSQAEADLENKKVKKSL